ncbi:MAG: hypothetical protein HZA93_09825 [Verrucomicrobia bacterium]|nr:hypothetical protein [Verrucomicrobiota bacterium]
MAGLRPREATTQATADVRADHLRVATGKRRRSARAVPVGAAFRAWWKLAPRTDPPFAAGRDRWLFDRIRADAGLVRWAGNISGKRTPLESAWQEDILQHTWISARLATT